MKAATEELAHEISMAVKDLSDCGVPKSFFVLWLLKLVRKHNNADIGEVVSRVPLDLRELLLKEVELYERTGGYELILGADWYDFSAEMARVAAAKKALLS